MLQQLSQGIAARLHGTAVHGKRGWKREISVLLKYQTEDGAANVDCASVDCTFNHDFNSDTCRPKYDSLANAVCLTFIVEMS